jgi:hypothetical protein
VREVRHGILRLTEGQQVWGMKEQEEIAPSAMKAIDCSRSRLLAFLQLKALDR